MMRTVLTAGLLCSAAVLTAPASLAQSPSNWTGFYVGGGAGYTSLDDNDGETVVFDTNRDGSFGDQVNTTAPANAFSPGFCNGGANGNAPAAGCTEGSDGEAGFNIRAGYDKQFGSWVFGGLVEFSRAEIGDAVSAFSTTPASYTFERELNSTAAIRARGGYAFGPGLVYATAGYARGDIDHSFRTTNAANSFAPSGDDDVDGYQVGVGFEKKLHGNWSLGAEYLFTSLNDEDYQIAVGPGTAPATNPFLLVNPTGTDMRRTQEDFDYGVFGVTLAWRP